MASLFEALELEKPITGNMFHFALLTGLRRGELLKLEWKDIDFEKGEIFLRNTKAGKDQILHQGFVAEVEHLNQIDLKSYIHNNNNNVTI